MIGNLSFGSFDTALYPYIYIIDSDILQGTERKVQTIQVPGRSGDLHIDNGRYENVTLTYTAIIVNDDRATRAIMEMNAALLAQTGYQELRDSFTPEYYRQGRFIGKIKPETTPDGKSIRVELEFDCKPQKWLCNTQSISLTNGDAITLVNPTFFTSKPLITTHGGGTLTYGGKTLTISSNNYDITIDCEIEEASYVYNGTTYSGNGYLSGNFPSFPPGAIALSYTGISPMTIEPRFYTL